MFTRTRLLLALAGHAVVTALALAQAPPFAGYDRPAANPRQSRSVVVAKHGIVATSHPLAAQAGLDILKAGGNAADAAIAANAMLGLAEPMSCGIGGDLFVIYWDAKTQKLYGLNASGRSPYTLNRDVFKREGAEEHSRPTACLSWSVPGCVGRLGRPARPVRHASRWPRFSRPRSTTPKKAFRSARSSPATGSTCAPKLKQISRFGQDLSDRRACAGRGRDLPQPAPGGQLSGDRRGRPAGLLSRDRSPSRSSPSARRTAAT